MEKVYRLLPWLNMAQALAWLRTMTSTQLTKDELLQLCDAGQCAVYLDCRGWKGEFALDIGDEYPIYESVKGRGFCKVEYPLLLADEGRHGTHVIGPAWVEHTRKVVENCEWWVTSDDSAPPEPLFKNADIQFLADKMNRAAGHLPSEVDALRQQLEQERAAREAAETELLKRRAEDGKRTLDNMRHMLMHDHKEFAAMQERAERAERMVASLDRQLTEQAERKRLNDKAFKEMAKQLREHHAGQQPDAKPEAPASGLTFPYATKELEAMRAAVAKYWEGYTTDKRQPTQKEVAIELGELLGLSLMKNKEPARKAVNLAAAIKPVDLPDA